MGTIPSGEQTTRVGKKLAEILRQLGQPGGYPHDLEKLADGLQLLVEGQFGGVATGNTLEAAARLLAPVTFSSGGRGNVGTVDATKEKETCLCFTDQGLYYDRDRNLDSFLMKIQSRSDGGRFSVCELRERARFSVIFAELLGVKPEEVEIVDALLNRGHVWTLPEIENLVERQQAGEDVGLDTNGHGNSFPVLNEYEHVSIVTVSRNAYTGVTHTPRWSVLHTNHARFTASRYERARFFLRQK